MNRKQSIIAIIGFAFLMFFSFVLDKYIILKKHHLYYIPPSKYLRLASGTYERFCGHIFYILGVLAVAEKTDETISDLDWVQQNMSVATDLDPNLIQAYFFAGVVMAKHNTANLDKGITFLKKGVANHPKNWKLLFWIGFNYLQQKNYKKAIEYYKKASVLPGAPYYLKSNLPMLHYQANELELGTMYLKGVLGTVNTPRQVKFMEQKLKWLEILALLRKQLIKYQKIYDKLPGSLDELVDMKELKKIPEDPFGQGFFINPKTKNVESSFKRAEIVLYLQQKVTRFQQLHKKLPKNLKEMVKLGLIKKTPRDPMGRGYYIDKKGKVK